MQPSKILRRRSIRWKGHDYTLPGDYFIAICIHQKKPLLGTVSERGWVLSPAGEMVKHVWLDMPKYHSAVELDTHTIMPTHLHAVVRIVGASHRARPSELDLSLGEIVKRFKTLTTRRYIDNVRLAGWSPFEGRLWQRNYLERVIRNREELHSICSYIDNNVDYGLAES